MLNVNEIAKLSVNAKPRALTKTGWYVDFAAALMAEILLNLDFVCDKRVA